MPGLGSPRQRHLLWGWAERPSLKDVLCPLALLHPAHSREPWLGGRAAPLALSPPERSLPAALADSVVLQELKLLVKVRVNRSQSPRQPWRGRGLEGAAVRRQWGDLLRRLRFPLE